MACEGSPYCTASSTGTSRIVLVEARRVPEPSFSPAVDGRSGRVASDELLRKALPLKGLGISMGTTVVPRATIEACSGRVGLAEGRRERRGEVLLEKRGEASGALVTSGKGPNG